MTSEPHVKLLREILDSVNLGEREESLMKYASYLSIATHLEAQMLEAKAERPYQFKNWQDTCKSRNSFLRAISKDEDSEWSPEQHLDSAKSYMIKIRPVED